MYLTTFPLSFLAKQMLPAELLRAAAFMAAFLCGRAEEEGATVSVIVLWYVPWSVFDILVIIVVVSTWTFLIRSI